jgi:hypothetical protein
MHHPNEDEMETVAETENYFVWRAQEEEGYVYHVELGGVSLHLMPEEWEELVTLIKSAS